VKKQLWHLDAPARVRLSVLGFFTSVGALEAAQVFWRASGGSSPKSVGYVVIAQMPWWYLWAALAPIIVVLGRLIRLDGKRRWLAALIHLLFSVVFAVLHLYLTSALFYFTISRGSWVESLSHQRRMFIDGYLVSGIITYWAILGAWSAFDAYRRLRYVELESAHLLARNAGLQAGLSRAKLESLQRQLNPHFLFNTLHTISGLVRRGQGRLATQMITRLGDLLHVSLGREEQQLVSLREDVELMDAYLAIELVRLSDRITVECSIDPAVLETRVPILMLQPLIENALRHGIEPTPGPGKIAISGGRDGADLLIEVENSGRGPSGAQGSGIGLSNTQARLSHLFGDSASISLVPGPGGCGTTARVRLPLEIEVA